MLSMQLAYPWAAQSKPGAQLKSRSAGTKYWGYLFLPPTWSDLTLVRVREWEDRERTEARTLLDCSGHRFTYWNVSLMKLAGGHGLKHVSSHGWPVIAQTGPQSPVLYKGDNNAARLPESGPAESGGLSISSLPLLFDGPTKKPGRKAHSKLMLLTLSDICLCLPTERTRHKVNDTKVDYSGGLGEGRSGPSRVSNPAGVCWSSAHLV